MTEPLKPSVQAFEREDRYIVIKRSHMTEGVELDLAMVMEGLAIDPVDAVVVEADWPEYEPVWQMIETRVSGRPPASDTAAPAAPGEPQYLIRKGGYYYRPNCRGYTTNITEAGRYTLEKAISESHPNGPNGPRDEMSFELAPPIASEGTGEALIALGRLVTDEEDDPCRLDHNGLCQAHFLEEHCSMAHARDLLRKAGRL